MNNFIKKYVFMIVRKMNLDDYNLHNHMYVQKVLTWEEEKI